MFDLQYFKEYLNTLITLTVDNVWLLELSVCMFGSPSCKGKQVLVQNSSHYQRATCAVSISYTIYLDLFCTQIVSYLSLPLPCICNSPAFHQSIKNQAIIKHEWHCQFLSDVTQKNTHIKT